MLNCWPFDRHADFLRLIAQKERRVHELREGKCLAILYVQHYSGGVDGWNLARTGGRNFAKLSRRRIRATENLSLTMRHSNVC